MLNTVLVLGAHSGIGQALLEQALLQGAHAIGVSRQAKPLQLSAAIAWYQLPQVCLTADRVTSVEMMQATETALSELLPSLCLQFQPDLIISCQGLLQQGDVSVEKSLRQLDVQSAQQSWWVNYLLPALQLKILMPYLTKQSCRMLVLSAKVGSISDNQLGGWYSYRAAKAAVNMLVKTTAIELQRNKSKSLLATVHPGTTATVLSQPFVANVPAHQLQSPDATARRLMAVAEGLSELQHGCLLHWDGSILPF